MDNLVAQPTGSLDSSYTTANGEQYWWNGGGWVDGAGKWYVITHIEFNNVSGVPMKRIGLSTSTDSRGKARILTDMLTRAAVLNLARLAVRGLHHAPTDWAVAAR